MIPAQTSRITDSLTRVKRCGNYSFFVDAASSTSGDRIGSEGVRDVYSDLRQRLAISFGDRACGNGIVIASIPHRDDKNGELVITFTSTLLTDLSQRLVGLSCNLRYDELDRASTHLRSNMASLRAALQIFDPRFKSELVLPAHPAPIAGSGEIYVKNGEPHFNLYPERSYRL